MATVVIEANPEKVYRQEIKAGSFNFAADAGTEHGGLGSAPNPHELLLGSLGACTAITIQMYAKRKGWDVKAVNIQLSEEQVEKPDAPGQKINRIIRHIDLSGDLTQEQIDNLKAIADKCPIHKLLQGPKEITTEVSHKA
jgi:putative redox protein